MLIEISEDQAEALTRLARRENVPLEALVLEAIRDFIHRRRTEAMDRAFGIRPGGEDGLAYQERLRAEWEGT